MEAKPFQVQALPHRPPRRAPRHRTRKQAPRPVMATVRVQNRRSPRLDHGDDGSDANSTSSDKVSVDVDDGVSSDDADTMHTEAPQNDPNNDVPPPPDPHDNGENGRGVAAAAIDVPHGHLRVYDNASGRSFVAYCAQHGPTCCVKRNACESHRVGREGQGRPIVFLRWLEDHSDPAVGDRDSHVHLTPDRGGRRRLRTAFEVTPEGAAFSRARERPPRGGEDREPTTVPR